MSTRSQPLVVAWWAITPGSGRVRTFELHSPPRLVARRSTRSWISGRNAFGLVAFEAAY
jgi:hypothetical protein